MCQQLYLPQIRQEEQKQQQQKSYSKSLSPKLPPPSPPPHNQLEQVPLTGRTRQQYYIHYLHDDIQTLYKSLQKIYSHSDHYQHEHYLTQNQHLRTLRLKNKKMFVPVLRHPGYAHHSHRRRPPFGLSFMLICVILLFFGNSIHFVQPHNCRHQHPKAHEVRLTVYHICS